MSEKKQPEPGSQPLANLKHDLFIESYLTGGAGNATNAYLEVYPDSSREAAGRSASDVLKRPEVQARLQYRARQILAEPQEITNARMRSELVDIVFSRPTDYWSEAGGWDVRRLIADRPGWIKKIKQKEIRRIEDSDGSPLAIYDVEIECYDRVKGVEVLGKITGLTEKADDLTEEAAAGLEAYGRAALERLRAKRNQQ